MPKKDKKTKSKARKRARQEELRQENERQVRVKLANYEQDGSVKDTLKDFLPFQNFTRNGLNLNITFGAGQTVPKDVSWEMFCVLKENMEDMYISNGWGWKNSEKRKEHTDEMARFLIAKGDDGSILGFTHFRFLLEGAYEVLYIYELQVAAAGRRHGLGKHMMQICELMARKNAMKKVMLTVFKANVGAMKFYTKKMKYQIDEISPSLSDDDFSQTYEILSKIVCPELKKRKTLLTPKSSP